MAEFEWRIFQGQAVVITETLNISGFAGTEILTASIYAGDTAPAVLTLVPVWNTGTTQTTPPTLIDTPFTAAQALALLPGSYAALISVATGGAALAKGILTVYPAPGGASPLFERALATPTIAQAMLPTMPQSQIDYLPFALRAATRAVETYCQRPLLLDSYDHIIRPNNSIRLRLRSRPIVEVSRIAVGQVAGLMIKSSAIQAATVQSLTAGPGSMQLSSLAFNAVIAGVAIPQTLTLATYTTFADLATAINALGNGWSALSDPNAGSYLVSDAFGSPGTRGAANNETVEIHTHTNRLGWYWDDPDLGFVELTEPIPGGFLVPNPRVERADTRQWGVRATYRAGFAVTAADIALGYYPVPEDLQAAVVMTAVAIMEATPMAGPVKSQTVKDRSYTLKDAHSLIPDAAKGILSSPRYTDIVI